MSTTIFKPAEEKNRRCRPLEAVDQVGYSQIRHKAKGIRLKGRKKYPSLSL
jgi:hypothetical protein